LERNWRKRWEFKLMLKCHCIHSSEIGTLIIRCWETSRTQKIHVFGWISPNDVLCSCFEGIYQLSMQKKTFKKITKLTVTGNYLFFFVFFFIIFFLSFIFATVLINNSFSYTSNVIITNIITTHYTIWIQFKNQRQFCFGNRQYLQREIILECLHQGMGVSNHETNAYFLTKFTLSVHLLASTPRQTLNIFYILKNKIINIKKKKSALFD
jgi:hypothetical protein